MLRYGLILAASVVIADQAVKWLVLNYFLTHADPVEVTSFFNLVLAWNRGVSFSLFHSDEAYAPFALSALALALSVNDNAIPYGLTLKLVSGGSTPALGSVLESWTISSPGTTSCSRSRRTCAA